MDCFRLRSLSFGGHVVAIAPRNDGRVGDLIMFWMQEAPALPKPEAISGPMVPVQVKPAQRRIAERFPRRYPKNEIG
jgi:hypothetical protein